MGFRVWREEDEEWLAWCHELVERVMNEHYQNQNPSVGSPPPEFQYYVALPGVHSDYENRTHEQLVGDVRVLHKFMHQLITEKNHLQDVTGTLVREKDQMVANAAKQRKQDRKWDKFKIWVLTIVLTGEGAVIGWLVTEFLARFK
jgi:hypothetical protein